MQQQLEIIVTFKDHSATGVKGVAKNTRQMAKGFKDAEKSVFDFNAAQKAMNQNMQQSTRGSANMTMALQSMNFTIRDSPYFFRDFSLGILAVGNNLNPMIDSVIRVKKEMGGWGGAMRAFAREMMGPSGVIMAFSLAVTAMQAIVFTMAKTKSAAEETENSIESLLGTMVEFEDPFSGEQFMMNPSDLGPAINRLKSDLDGLNESIKQNLIIRKESVAGTGDDIFGLGGGKPIWTSVAELWGDPKEYFKGITEVANLSKEERDKILNLSGEELLTEKESLKILEKKLEYDQELSKELKAQIVSLEAKRMLYERLSQLGVSTVPAPEIPKLDISDSITEIENELGKLNDIEDGFITDRWDREIEANRDIAEKIEDWRIDAHANEKTRQEERLKLEAARMKQELDFQYAMGYISEEIYAKANEALAGALAQNLKDLIKDTKKATSALTSLANTLGAAIYNAFASGKFAADEFLKSLFAVAAQMAIIESIKLAFGLPSLFNFSQGGIVKASGGYITTGNGSHDYIPAMLRPREMVLNPNQQQELFNMTKGMNSGGHNQKVDVVVSGQVTESKNAFHTRVRKANVHYSTTRSMGTIGRS